MRKQKLARFKKNKKIISLPRKHLQNRLSKFSVNFRQKRASSTVIRRRNFTLCLCALVPLPLFLEKKGTKFSVIESRHLKTIQRRVGS